MIKHLVQRRFCQPLASNRLLLRLKTDIPGRFETVIVVKNAASAWPMTLTARTRRYFYYQVAVELDRPWECHYYFHGGRAAGESLFLSGNGLTGPDIEPVPFLYQWGPERIHAIPDWVYDAIFYQIFPDRFYNGDPANDPPGTVPWDEAPTTANFFGGDLPGVREKIPYLKDLGINAIWFNPIFAASSNHRYNTADYLRVDPGLGTNQDLVDLAAALRRADMRLVLDGVFNHSGTDFFAFQDVIAHGPASPYWSWYYCTSWPICQEPGRTNYACWWDFPSLPKLMVTNPETRRYLLEVGSYWVRQAQISGWRLDVPNEIEPTFWAEFRNEVRRADPETYIVGEIWHDARFWLWRRLFDGVMNYLFRDTVLDYFAKRRITLAQLDLRLGRTRLRYPENANFALLNLLDSHDTARVITVFQDELTGQPGHNGSYDEAVRHLRPALLLLFTYPGAPLLYYGDEIGMVGGPDPGCRHTFTWDESAWNLPFYSFIKLLIRLRNEHAPLRRGLFEPVLADDPTEIYIFARRYQGERMIIILNCGDREKNISYDAASLGLEDGTALRDGISGREIKVSGAKLELTLADNDGAILF